MNNKTLISLIILLINSTYVVNATVLQGTVYDNNLNKQVANVGISLHDKNGNEIYSKQTNNTGRFEFNLEQHLGKEMYIKIQTAGWTIVRPDIPNFIVTDDLLSKDYDIRIEENSKPILKKLTYGVQILALKKPLSGQEKQKYVNLHELDFLENYTANQLWKYGFGIVKTREQAVYLLKDIQKSINEQMPNYKEKPFIIELKNNKPLEMIYRLQVFSSTKSKKEIIDEFEKKYDMPIKEEKRGYFLYPYCYVSEKICYTYAEARSLRAELVAAGIKTPFIVAYQKETGRRLKKIRQWFMGM